MAIDFEKCLDENGWLKREITETLTKEDLLQIVDYNRSGHRISLHYNYLPQGILNDVEILRAMQSAGKEACPIFYSGDKLPVKLILENLSTYDFPRRKFKAGSIKEDVFYEFISSDASVRNEEDAMFIMDAALSLGDEAVAEVLVQNREVLRLLSNQQVPDGYLFMVANNDELIKKFKEKLVEDNTFAMQMSLQNQLQDYERICDKVSKMAGENYMYDPDRDRHSREQPYEVRVSEKQKQAVAKAQERKTTDIPELFKETPVIKHFVEVIPDSFLKLANGTISREEFNEQLKNIASKLYDKCSSKETFDAILKPLLERGDQLLKQAISERELQNYDKAPKDRAIDSAIGPYLT